MGIVCKPGTAYSSWCFFSNFHLPFRGSPELKTIRALAAHSGRTVSASVDRGYESQTLENAQGKTFDSRCSS